MKKRSLKSNSSGQVIIITALLIATLLLSTAIYVIETEKEVPTASTGEENVFTGYLQSARNTLISALSNVTSGGDTSVLTSDLNELNTAITSYSYQNMVQMDFTPSDMSPYQNGIWISWGTDGQGISSAYADFTFNSSAPSTASSLEYAVNVTSEVDLSGSYQQLNDTSKQADLTVNLLNDGEPALAQNLTFCFQNDTAGWVTVDSPSISDFGTGTYGVSFIAGTDQPTGPLPVSVLCQDQRGIFVAANVTCNNMP